VKCGPCVARVPVPAQVPYCARALYLGRNMGAGDGNRTRMTSLEGYGPLAADQDKRRSVGMRACL
jgi:hypothetical protein